MGFEIISACGTYGAGYADMREGDKTNDLEVDGSRVSKLILKKWVGNRGLD